MSKERTVLDLKHATPGILVVGDLMVDHYLAGSARRISPEAPVPVVEIGHEYETLGGAGNVTRNLLAFGARVVVASAIGDDATGYEVTDMLRKRGLSTDAIVVQAGRRTSRKTRVIVTQQQVVRFDRESRQPIDGKTEAALLAAIERQADGIDLVLLSDYDKGVLTPSFTQAVIRWARRRSLPVLVDPKGIDYGKYRGATLITPNKKEAAELTGIAIVGEETLREAGESLQRKLGIPHVVITLSEDGMAIFDGRMTRIATVARDVYDVTGAGDTVLAMLGFCLACQVPLQQAARYANSAAAVVVGKPGSATTTFDEIHDYQRIASPHTISAPVASFDSIEREARRLRERGETIVFTNGCFDLLHRGHVEYLQASRACGDRLIVGINSDASVRRLKGPERPVVPEEDRAHILAALACVDYVVVFEEDTPYELIQRVRPDILTKGEDYADKQVVGRDIAREVRLISFVKGRSTSTTISRIRHAA